MKYSVISIFPGLLKSFSEAGVFSQGLKKNKIELELLNPREFTTDLHKTVDDKPYGGGDGMLMLAEPLALAVEQLKASHSSAKTRVIYLSPQGSILNDRKAKELVQKYDHLILVCGRYGGVDQRFIDSFVDEEISVGDFVLSGGELAAGILMEVTSRFVPGVLGAAASPIQDSFLDGKLEAPQYTRPEIWREQPVPPVLLCGDPKKISQHNSSLAEQVTLQKRPDLLGTSRPLTAPVSVGLLHYPIQDREKKIVATNITNFDIHDIARAATVYGVDKYYLIHPMKEQLMFVDRILMHWRTGFGSKFNPFRKKALNSVLSVESLEKALLEWGVEKPLVIATHARAVPGVKSWSCKELHSYIREPSARPVFLLFGTGFGMTDEFMRGCDGVLESIRGAPPADFRHLSVRSAVSIYLDRILGPW